MAPILSRACEHALLSLIYMARYGGDTVWDISHMADALSLSHHTLGKVLQTLAKAGLVISKKGPEGGFRLGRAPDTITLMDVLAVFHEQDLFARCLIGIPVCSDEAPCPVHQHWGPVRDKLCQLCETTSIAELAATDERPSYFATIAPGLTRAGH